MEYNFWIGCNDTGISLNGDLREGLFSIKFIEIFILTLAKIMVQIPGFWDLRARFQDFGTRFQDLRFRFLALRTRF